MPTYEVDVGGHTYEVDAPDPDTAWQWANMTAQAAPSMPPAAPKQSTFLGELRRGFEQPLSSIRTAAGATFGSPEEAAAAGIKRGQEIAERTGEGPSLEAVKRAKEQGGDWAAVREAISQVPRALAGQGGTMATAAGAGRVGAKLGSRFGPVGAIVGGAAGATAGMLPQFFGANVERQAAEQQEQGAPIDINRSRAATAAAGQAALEGAGQSLMFGKRIVKGVLGIADDAALRSAAAQEQLVNLAKQSVAGAGARGVARGAGEIPVEIGQQILERWQAGLPLTDADAMKEYGEAAYLAGLVGGPIGGASQILARNAAKREVEAPPPAEAQTPQAAKTVEEEFAEEPKLQQPAPAPAPEPEVPTKGREEVTNPLTWMAGPKKEESEQVAEELPKAEPEEVAAKGREEVTNPLMWAAGPKKAETFRQFTAQDIVDTGVQLDSSAKWFADNVVGKTKDEVQALVDARPHLARGNRPQARILRSLLAPTVPAFEEAPNVPTTEKPAIKPANEPGRSKPSLGVPGGATDTGNLGARVQPAPAATEPVGRGLVPTEQPASKGRAAEVTQPSTLNEPAPIEEPATPPSEPVAETATAAAPEAPALAAPTDPVTLQFPIKTQLTQAAEDMTLPEATRKEAAGLSAIMTEGAGPQRAAKKFLEHVGKIRAANARREAVAKGTAPVKTETDAEVEARRKEAADMAARMEEARKQEVTERKRAQAEANAASEELRKARAEAEKAKAEADKAKEAAKAAKAAAPKRTKKDTEERAIALDSREDFTLENRHRYYLDKLIRKGQIDEANRVMDLIEQRVRSKVYSQTETAGRALSPEVVEMLRKDNLTGAMELMAKQAETKLARSLAERLAALLTKTDVRVIDNLVNDKGERVRGAARSDGKIIWLDTDTGLDEETLLHEAVHAASERALNMDPKSWTDAQRAAVGELHQIWRSAKKDATINLSEEAQASLSEFVTEAMTNHDLQKALAVKPWKKSTAWDKFKTHLLRMIGVADPQTMLDSTIGAMDTIFLQPAPGKGPVKILSHATKNGQAILASLGITNPQQIYGTKAMYKGMANSADVSAIDKVRTKVADAAASIDKRIMTYFNGAVRNSLGELNPMGLYRQAQDYSKMLLSFFKAGSIEKDTTTGLWMVKDKGTTPPAKVLELVQKFADTRQTSFEEAMGIAGRTLEAFRMEQLLKQDPQFPNHLTQKELAAGLALYNSSPIFAEMNAAMDASRKELVDHMVAVGRLSVDDGKDWKDVIGYVPFDRIEDFATNYAKTKRTGSRSPLSVTKLPKLIGSNVRPVGNVFENYLNTMGWMVGQVMNTDARNQTLSFLESIKQAKFLGADTQGRPNVAYGYKDGGLVYWELPSEYDVLAFKSETQTTGVWLRNLSAASDILRTSVTALPPFALKQVIDDIQRALLTSGVKNPLSLIGMVLTNFPKIALAEIRGVRHRIVEDAEALGLSGEYDFKAGRPGATFMEDMGYVPRGAFRTLIHKLDGITRASDLAVRKAIYDQTIKETKSTMQGGDVLLAQTRAREFINFRRRGSSDFVGVMVKTIPFFNAYVQGMDVLYRSASGIDSGASVDRAVARKMFWSRASIAIALSTVYAMGKDDDDEEYNEADLRMRDGNWFVGGYKFSVPGELGAIFKVIPERVVEYYKRKGTPEEQEAMEAVRTSLSYAFEQYVGRVTPVPQAVKPLLEAWTNYSFLTGRELVGIHQKQLTPSMQVRENTSELAIQIAKFAKDVVGVDAVSPILIDNVLRGYLGSTAAMTVMVTDGLLNPTRIDRPLHKYALLSNYMIDPIGKRRIAEFYDERDRVGRANTTLNELVAQGKLNEAIAYADEHAQELMLNTSINATLEDLEQTRAYRKYLNSEEAAMAMSMEERMEKRAEIEKTERELVGWLREAKTLIRRGG